MKKLLVPLALGLLVSCAAHSQQGFKVSGQIKGKTEGVLFLSCAQDSKKSKQIAVGPQGNFEFRDSVGAESPAEYTLMDPTGMTLFKGGAGMGVSMRFFAQNGDDLKIAADAKNFRMADVSGNVYNSQLMELNNAIKEPLAKEDIVWDQVKALMKQRNPANAHKIDSLSNLADPYEQQITDIKKDFVSKHPDYLASATALIDIYGKIPASEMDQLYMAFTEQVKQTPSGLLAADNLGRARAKEDAEAGKPAADFAKKDRDGRIIKLSDYRGKYVLLDFWGSWCGACRASHPHLKQTAQKYAADGLVVIGIAEERTNDKSAWLKAIKVDGLPWTQIMNDEGREKSDLVKLYGVDGFPTKILIGPDGKIIMRYVGTNAGGSLASHDGADNPGTTGGAASNATGASSTASSSAAASSAASSAGSTTAAASTVATTTGNAQELPPTALDNKLREIFKK